MESNIEEKVECFLGLIHAFFLNIIKRIGGVTTFATPRVVYLQHDYHEIYLRICVTQDAAARWWHVYGKGDIK